MTQGLYIWSKTAASNGTADASINFAEGMSPSAVNDSARAVMARVAEYRDDHGGALTTSGTSTAYTLTTNQSFDTLAHLDGQSLRIKFNATNGASPTLNVDSLGAKAIKVDTSTAVGTGVIKANSIWDVTYDNSNSCFILSGVPAQIQDGTVATASIAANAVTAAKIADATITATQIADGVVPIVAPQGRLSVTGGPVATADVAITHLAYNHYIGNLVPVSDGSKFTMSTFTDGMQLTLDSTGHVLGGIYDVFLFNDSGTLRLGTGPEWSVVTAGSCARGTGAGTTELVRLNGLWTNKVSMTARNNSTTYTVAASAGTYLGSIYISTTAGSLTCQVSAGGSRVWDVWNAYNRLPIILKVTDNTSSWNGTSALRQTNGNSANTLAAFCGLAEEWFDIRYLQFAKAAASNNINLIGIGVNSTSAFAGHLGKQVSGPQTSMDQNCDMVASYLMPPALGLNNINALEQAASSSTLSGTEQYMLMSAKWMG